MLMRQGRRFGTEIAPLRGALSGRLQRLRDRDGHRATARRAGAGLDVGQALGAFENNWSLFLQRVPDVVFLHDRRAQALSFPAGNPAASSSSSSSKS